jgi:hypothetical protein
MSDDEADWAFGDGGFAKLYGDRLVQSSIMDETVATRWVFLFMCARADAAGRFYAATVEGLARAANVTPAQARKAVERLEAPDPASTTPDNEGRRIKRIPGGWLVLNLEKFRNYQTKRQRDEADRKKRQREAAEQRRLEREAVLARREAEVARLEQEMGRVPGRPGDIPGTSAPDVRRQTSDVNNGEHPPTPLRGNGGGNGSRKDTGAATTGDMATLEAEPALVDIADAWVQAFKRPRRELGVLRAARAALAGGYAPDSIRLVVRVVALAREAPERFADRGSIRWSVEHGKLDPGYVLRPSTLDRLIPEAEAWDRA